MKSIFSVTVLLSIFAIGSNAQAGSISVQKLKKILKESVEMSENLNAGVVTGSKYKQYCNIVFVPNMGIFSVEGEHGETIDEVELPKSGTVSVDIDGDSGTTVTTYAFKQRGNRNPALISIRTYEDTPTFTVSVRSSGRKNAISCHFSE